MLTIDDLERKFYQEKYAPGLSTGRVIERENLISNPKVVGLFEWTTFGGGTGGGTPVTLTANAGAARVTAGVAATQTNAEISPTGPTANRIKSDSQGRMTFVFTGVSSSLRTGGFIRCRPSDGSGDVAFPLITRGGEIDVTPKTYVIDITGLVSSAFYTVAYKETGAAAWAQNEWIEMSKPLLMVGSPLDKSYFDGDTADFNNGSYEWTGTANASTSRLYVPEPVIAENLADEFFKLVGGDTLTRNVKDDWHLFTSNNTGGLRTRCKLSELVNGQTYYIAIEVYNPESSPVDIVLEWCDINVFSGSLNSGETRVLKYSGSKAVYDDVYRFMDLHISGVSLRTIWFRKPTISRVSLEPFNGNSPNSYWTGVSDNTNQYSKARMIDMNSRDFSFMERDYWAKTSGLAPKESYSVADHQMAALKLTEPAGTVNDMLRSFFARQSGLPAKSSASDHELAFYQTQLGVS